MSNLFSILLIILMSSFSSFGQITNPNTPVNEVKKKKENKKKKEDKANVVTIPIKDKTTYYLTAAYIHSFRTFEDQSAYQSLWRKYDETPIQTFGLGFGTYINLAKGLDLELGVSYVLQGEEYSFKDSLSDSTFHYINKYKHLGIPLRLKYTIGNGNFKGFIYGGIIPSSILSIRYESDYTNKANVKIENDIQTKTNNLRSFNLTGSAGVGLQYDFNEVGFILQPEYRYNFTNSYINYPVKHNLWSWGINAGISFKI